MNNNYKNLTFSMETDSSVWKDEIQNILRAFKSLVKIIERNIFLPGNNWSFDVLLSDHDSIRILNYRYRGKNKATNILSFPQYQSLKQIKKFSRNKILGDIILCWSVIQQESLFQNKNFLDHLSHLFLHGLLHLLGFSHDKIKPAKYMENLEVLILHSIKISNPY